MDETPAYFLGSERNLPIPSLELAFDIVAFE